MYNYNSCFCHIETTPLNKVSLGKRTYPMISSVNKMTSGYARSLGESLILASTFHMTHASIIVIQHNLHPGRIIQFFEYFFTKK